MSDIIKNPERLEPKPQPKYVPEYIKHNIEPVNFGTVDYGGVDDQMFDGGDEVRLSATSGHIIDNNDYVDFGFDSKLKSIPIPNQKTNDIKVPETNEYILMIFGKLVLSGSISIIENKVKAVIYGEDKEFNRPVNIDDIVVLKRVSIKVGVFIGE
jgi:hypothetical protein